jgi:hypothetical protein
MARTTSLPFVERLLDGNLETELRRRRAIPESFENIARWLANEHDIDVSSATVRRWCIEYRIDEAA